MNSRIHGISPFRRAVRVFFAFATVLAMTPLQAQESERYDPDFADDLRTAEHPNRTSVSGAWEFSPKGASCSTAGVDPSNPASLAWEFGSGLSVGVKMSIVPEDCSAITITIFESKKEAVRMDLFHEDKGGLHINGSFYDEKLSRALVDGYLPTLKSMQGKTTTVELVFWEHGGIDLLFDGEEFPLAAKIPSVSPTGLKVEFTSGSLLLEKVEVDIIKWE